MSSQSELPVDAVLPQVIAALARSSSLVLRAPTGAGKTTRVPPAILDSGLIATGAVLVVQPRRLATRAAASFIARERGGRLGDEVGYIVRFDSRVRRDSRLIVLTEGILLRMLQDDPFLSGAAAVVFDEFHERNLNSDLALGMVRRIQETVRPELRIVVMSATLHTASVAAWLGDCPIVESEGRTFPVDVRYRTSVDRKPIAELAAGGVADLLGRTAGDLLVFLPGVGEIRQTRRALEPLAARENLILRELYGDLPADEQDAVLLPGPQRKVVLATNVAETSLTIEGVTGVVDSGLARIKLFDPHVGLDRLELTPVSRASADQRAGRAGRLQPGICLRLWDEAAHRRRPEFTTPEIHRVDLAGPVLQLKSWGEADILAFPWFEPPAAEAVVHAEALLRRLDALDEAGITPLGRDMVRLPVQPRLARLLIEGGRLGAPAEAALAAALLSERDPFVRRASVGPTGGPPTKAIHRSRSDVLDRVQALQEFARSGRRDFEMGAVNPGAAHFILRAQQQLVQSVREELGDRPGNGEDSRSSGASFAALSPASATPGFPATRAACSTEVALLRSLLAAFPDRLARRRASADPRGLLGSGRGVKLAPQSAVTDAEFFLCIDVDAAQGEAVVRQASAVERDWLPDSHRVVRDEVFFHPSQKRLAARRRTSWEGVVLEEVAIPVPQDESAARILAEAAIARWEHVFPADDPAVAGLLARVRSLGEWMPELDLPPFDDPQLHHLAGLLCHQARSLDDLRQAPWLDALRSLLGPQRLAIVDREAPERLPVPSGSRITLQYEPGRPPVLAVRIQEVFGLKETPRIAAGRVPVLLHLLGPNHRPQQVTDDLHSFWTNTYPALRKELRRRYPRHAWPEDPWTAVAEKRPQRRKE